MPRAVRIGNAHGFWGDRLEAAAEMLALDPQLDFLTLDFLAEVSMSILALQRDRNPHAGFARDFVDVVASLVPYWEAGGRCRVITNAGGLNPAACARACQDVLQQAGVHGLTLAIVSGDDVMELLRADVAAGAHVDQRRNLDTGERLEDVIDRLSTANAYVGAAPIAEALARGADLVITGRVADPSLTVGACVHHFGWKWDEWDRLAGATIAGHLIECGTQVTGGISTDWLDVPNAARIGFPIVEVQQDGSCIVTKPEGSGGRVTEDTVKEQLLYEIGDPDNYLSPDVIVSFLSLDVRTQAADRIQIHGAKGRPAPATFKVSATWQHGYRAAGQLTVYGHDVLRKGHRTAELVLEQLHREGITFRETVVELIGSGACWPNSRDESTRAATREDELQEVVLRIAVADDSRQAVERFTRALMPLITAGPPGTTGYAEGRPRVHPHFAFWPCLIERERVVSQVELLTDADATAPRRLAADGPIASSAALAHVDEPMPRREPTTSPRRLADIALARSGDKGRHANIGIIAREAPDFALLRREVTSERVARHLGISALSRVQRYELPNLGALNFVVRDILDSPLRLDAQGKALGQVLLRMRLGEHAENTDSTPT